ncbi:hypothetical protein AB8B21_07515 [Tardiphaga sp. 866_E4_N2_1]|uniref:hypothetical protein n=1 Tax=unclassified Tardiphaga TaxID=2631404 RepID=UPI003F228DBA
MLAKYPSDLDDFAISGSIHWVGLSRWLFGKENLHLFKAGCGIKGDAEVTLIRPGLGELLDHVPVLVKAYGKWPSYMYLFVMSLWTPLLVTAASWLAWRGWR